VQTYPVRASHRVNLPAPALRAIAQSHFDSVEVDGDTVIASFGAIARLSARGVGRELVLEVTMNPNVPEEVARETIRRYNLFLEEVTGFSSKERAKRLRKSAGGAPSGA
jgi:hypothetical protein